MKKTKEPTLTLDYAVKIYIVYLRSKKISPAKFAAYLRVLRHIMIFYGYKYHLNKFSGSRVLQYADIYDPWNASPFAQERGQVFWKFIHWMKKNEMIPAFTAKEID
jgi:hypothetical protein